MDQQSSSTYVYTISLGETRWERFYLVLNQDVKSALYPAGNKSDPGAHIMGPDDKRAARNWLIDGRKDGSKAGAAYQIKFEWGTSMAISWAATGREDVGNAMAHTYYLSGSWAAWNLQPMTLSTQEDDCYEGVFKISARGWEEFQIIRDRDMAQVIHPAQGKALDVSVPVRGPDDKGRGKNWLVRGRMLEPVRVRLKVSDGLLFVTVISKTLGQKRFQSGHEARAYYLAGSFNAWTLQGMQACDDAVGVHHAFISVGVEGYEDFQIIVDEDWTQRFYPGIPGAASGEALLAGPDLAANGESWRVLGNPGEEFEIILDLTQQDRRKIVQWHRAGGVASQIPKLGGFIEDPAVTVEVMDLESPGHQFAFAEPTQLSTA